ncbi:UDP-glycosyltransferase UGT46A1 [Danaus plexippus plexippus]|uniref:UDP-glucuronosyltransferase n=1 Tax=Danaus plexippus plexippus TaxID=278856 RepID=A0A212FA68_DANPL|nr:UDP-glycosyltransferase UGT46A1 [Danaus plexippus plexippus]
MVFEPLLRRFAERGHNVTVASFFPMENPPENYDQISFLGLAELRLESLDLEIFERTNLLNKIPIIGNVAKALSAIPSLAKSALDVCERVVKHQELSQALKNKYDAVITENFNSDCMLGLLYAYEVDAPVISILSGTPMPWTAQRIGADDNPAHVPVILSKFTSRMSFTERLENALINLLSKYLFYHEIQTKERAFIEKRLGKIPHPHDLSKNMSLILLNSFHPLNGVKPSVPGMIEVGGIHLAAERKPLPTFIEKFINESEHGVIVFSFGSHIKTKTLPKYKEEIFLRALSKTKQRVIWKFEESDEEGTLIGNILRVNWIPQYELLNHDKVVAFICHGGLLGMTEAVSSGKPMLVLPFFGDQFTNAAAASEAGIARVVSYNDLSEDTFTDALNEVLGAKTRETAQRLSKIWKDRESSPLDTAVFWTERVIRWGKAAPLHSTSRDLPFYQLALLDVAAAVIVVTILFITAICYILVKILRVITKSSKEKIH